VVVAFPSGTKAFALETVGIGGSRFSTSGILAKVSSVNEMVIRIAIDFLLKNLQSRKYKNR